MAFASATLVPVSCRDAPTTNHRRRITADQQPQTNHRRPTTNDDDFPAPVAGIPEAPNAIDGFSWGSALDLCGTSVADRAGDLMQGGRMFGSVAPYLMAAFGMAFAAASALTLIHFVGHLDPPEVASRTSTQ